MFDPKRLMDFQAKRSSHFENKYGSLYLPPSDEITLKVMADVERIGRSYIYTTLKNLKLDKLVAFGIISSPSMRAFASRNDQGYLIGLHAGTIFYLYNLCRAMLAKQSIFPLVGPEPTTVEFDFDFRNTAIYAPILSFPSLQNNSRTNIAYQIFRQMILWLICHELSHIMHGHVDFVMSQGALGMISDPDVPYSDAETVLENHALEIIADCLATTNSTKFAWKGINFTNAWAEREQRFKELMPAVCNMLSIAALFRAFSPKSDTRIPVTTHPAARVRMAAVASMHQEMIRLIDMPFVEANTLLVHGPIDLCEAAFADRAGLIGELGDWDTNLEVEAERHRLMSKANLMISKDLLEYSFVPIQNINR